MSLEIEERVKKVISNVFGIESHAISEETSPDTLGKWDSLGHMNLVFALEEEFNVQFNDIQIIEMLSYPLIICTLKEIMQQ